MMAADETFQPTLFGFSNMMEVTKSMYHLSALSHFPSLHFSCKSLFIGEVKMMYSKALLEGKDEVKATEAALEGVERPETLRIFTASMNSTTGIIRKFMSERAGSHQFEDLPSHIVHPELPKDFDYSRVPTRVSSKLVSRFFQTALLNIAKDVHAVLALRSGCKDTATRKADVDSLVSGIARFFYNSKRCHKSFNQLVLSMSRMQIEVTKAQKIVVRLLLLRGTMRAADPYDCSAPADLIQYYTRPMHDKKYGLPRVSKVP
jgi:hypothetical protein